MEGSITNYRNDETPAKVHSLIDVALAIKTCRPGKLYFGEFGVYRQNIPDSNCRNWYNDVHSCLESNGIAMIIRVCQGDFVFFRKGTNEQFLNNLNILLVQALGLTASAQQVYVLKSDTDGFSILTDFIGEKFSYINIPYLRTRKIEPGTLNASKTFQTSNLKLFKPQTLNPEP